MTTLCVIMNGERLDVTMSEIDRKDSTVKEWAAYLVERINRRIDERIRIERGDRS